MNDITRDFHIKTPYYVFDIKELRSRASKLKEMADARGVSLCYAIKANSFINPYLSDLVEGFEVCSHGELKTCKAQGLECDKIVLSGVNKEKEFVRDGVLSGVGIVTAESAAHFAIINQVSAEEKRQVNVILRLSSGAQFGMDRSVMEEIIGNRDSYEYIKIVGIHYFTGTQKKNLKKKTAELEMLYTLICELKEAYGYEPELLEYGPGMWVPYFTGDEFENELQTFEELLDYICEQKYPYKVTLEMGRFFAASCGKYVTSVADCKTNDGLPVCIIDGGKNHLNYYGQNMALKTPLIEHLKMPGASERSSEEQKWTLFGSLCSFNDIIAREVPLTDLEIGDRLIFHHVGAYSVTEGIYLFLSRAMPDIYLLTEDKGLLHVRDALETYRFNGGE